MHNIIVKYWMPRKCHFEGKEDSSDQKLLHDNARPLIAIATWQKLDAITWEALQHPPCSPDLSPCDFYLFGLLKEVHGGQCFDDNEAVEEFLLQKVFFLKE